MQAFRDHARRLQREADVACAAIMVVLGMAALVLGVLLERAQP